MWGCASGPPLPVFGLTPSPVGPRLKTGGELELRGSCYGGLCYVAAFCCYPIFCSIS
jgi:hypothetical protein